MAIRVIRICDECGTEYEQVIGGTAVERAFVKKVGEVRYPVDFVCSDCTIKIWNDVKIDGVDCEGVND